MGDDEWTQIKPKSRKGKKKGGKPIPGLQTETDSQKPPRTHDLRSVEEITKDYETVKRYWIDSGSEKKLRDAVSKEKAKIGKGSISSAVCLGLGTLDPEDGAPTQKRKSFIQLAAFLVMVEELEKATAAKIPCIFQDPCSTQSDKDFLASLGHKVVDSPEGLEYIDKDCFFYAIHLYRPVYAAVVQKALPKIFVGTEYDQWDMIGNDMSDLAPMKTMEETYSRINFPCDTVDVFHATVIYTRPAELQPTTEEKEQLELNSSEPPRSDDKSAVKSDAEEDLASKLAATKLDSTSHNGF